MHKNHSSFHCSQNIDNHCYPIIFKNYMSIRMAAYISLCIKHMGNCEHTHSTIHRITITHSQHTHTHPCKSFGQIYTHHLKFQWGEEGCYTFITVRCAMQLRPCFSYVCVCFHIFTKGFHFKAPLQLLICLPDINIMVHILSY